jgi:hypothetical protein
MKNLTPSLVLLTSGSLTFLSGVSSRVWRGDEPSFRIIALIFGAVCIAMGTLALLGYVDIRD